MKKGLSARMSWMAAIVMCASLCGCGTIRPALHQYTFLDQDQQLSGRIYEVYNLMNVNSRDKLSVVVTQPEADTIVFSRGPQISIMEHQTEPLELVPGVFPFQLKTGEYGKPYLSGALMAYNIDKTVALARLGKTEDTKLFNLDLIEQARRGVLARYTMRFDDKDVLTYWLGNRTHLDTGGDPTVEVDFSQTPGITALTINGFRVNNFVDVLPVYRYETQPGGTRQAYRRDHTLVMVCDGRTYKGYLRNLRDNEFTAFVRIPCTIPKELLDAASNGTVSKFTVLSEGQKREAVAEIVISGE